MRPCSIIRGGLGVRFLRGFSAVAIRPFLPAPVTPDITGDKRTSHQQNKHQLQPVSFRRAGNKYISTDFAFQRSPVTDAAFRLSVDDLRNTYRVAGVFRHPLVTKPRCDRAA